MTTEAPSPYYYLAPDSKARSAALATRSLNQGTTVLSTRPLATVLITSEKGKRCDECLQVPPGQKVLRRCSGCRRMWYCSSECQNRAWKTHHRRLCKDLDYFCTSQSFSSLPEHLQLDSLLLAQFIAEHFSDASASSVPENDPSSRISVFLSLLPHATAQPPPPLPRLNPKPSEELVQRLYSRFENNNFVLHSHFHSFAHGIFPWASRSFNHSCAPNAAHVYIFDKEGATMEIKLLRDLSQDEEITIPYLDPALPFATRQQTLQISYGFTCRCEMCEFMKSLPPIPEPSSSMHEVEQLLRSIVIRDRSSSRLPTKPALSTLPSELLPLLHESYLSSLSSTFSLASHEGPFPVAVEAGETLLALYILLYPAHYPQIGIHALELAKTAWNAIVTGAGDGQTEETLLKSTRTYLRWSREVLDIIGEEGDEGGPFHESRQLEALLVQ